MPITKQANVRTLPPKNTKIARGSIINPDNIELLSKRERELVSHLIAKYQSYEMDFSVIKALEERINDDRNFELEDDEGRDQ